jgi:hypothetical protein
MIRLLTFLFVGLFTTACSPSARQRISLYTNSDEVKEKKPMFFQGQEKYDSLISLIDTTAQFADFYSLEYSDNFQNNKLVRGKLNQKNEIIQMELEETFKKGMQIVTRYYYSGAFLFYAHQIVRDYQKVKGGYMETFSYFGQNKKPKISASRIADSEENLASKNFKICDKKNFDPSEALDIVNQQGKYETRFQGSLEAERLKFILVGTSGEINAHSAVAYNQDFPIAEELVKKEAYYLNRPLKIEFTKTTGQNGFSYQALTRILILDEE